MYICVFETYIGTKNDVFNRIRSLLILLYKEKLKMLTTFKNGFFERERERDTHRERKNEKNYST
jgi:hypothetical protein